MTDDFLSPPIERSSEPKRQDVRAICAALDRLRKDVSVEGGRLIIAEKADVRALLDDYDRLTTEPSYVNGFEDGKKNAAEPVRCDGCGSPWTDEDLARQKAANPTLLSCCPERKPLTITQWRERAIEAEAKIARRANVEPTPNRELRNIRQWLHRIEEACSSPLASTVLRAIRESALAALRGQEAPDVGLVAPSIGETKADAADNLSTLLRKLKAWRSFDDVKFRTISVEEIRTLVEGIEAMAGFKVAAERDGWIKRAEVAEADVERFKAEVADLHAECDRIAAKRDKAAEERDLARGEAERLRGGRDAVAADRDFWQQTAEERGKELVLLRDKVENAKAALDQGWPAS